MSFKLKPDEFLKIMRKGWCHAMTKTVFTASNLKILAVTMIFAAAFCIITTGCGSAKKASDIKASVAFVNGTVEAQTGGDPAWKKISANSELSMADSIRTLEKSTAKLNFTDGAKVFLEEQTTLNLKTLSRPDEKSTLDIVVEIVSGAIFFDVTKRENSKFQMETSVAVAGVKGTKGVFRKHGGLKVVLIEGKVEVYHKDHPDKKVILEESELVEIMDNKAPGDKQKIDLAKEKFSGVPLMKNINPEDFTSRIDVINTK